MLAVSRRFFPDNGGRAVLTALGTAGLTGVVSCDGEAANGNFVCFIGETWPLMMLLLLLLLAVLLMLLSLLLFLITAFDEGFVAAGRESDDASFCYRGQPGTTRHCYMRTSV